MSHVNFQELHDHVYGFKASEHVASCAECGRRAEELRSERERLGRVLAADSAEEEPPPPPESLLNWKPAPAARVRRFRPGLLVAAAAAVLVSGLIWALAGPSGVRQPSNPGSRIAVRPTSRRPASYPVQGQPPTPKSAPLPLPPPESQPLVDVPFYTTQVMERTWTINMRGVVAEVLRLKGKPRMRELVLEQMRADEERVQSLLKKLAEAGVQLDVPGRMKIDDQILALGEQQVAGVPVAQGRDVLEAWLRKFRPPVLIEEIHVQREGQRVTLYMGFPKETKDLLAIARFPDSIPEGVAPASNPNPASAQAPVALPRVGLEAIRGRFELLPKGYYQLLTVFNRTRLERLEKTRSGTMDDLNFLSNLQKKVLPRFEAEAAEIRAKVRALEPMALKESVAADVVYFKSPPGRKIQGKIVEETDTHVTVKLRFGAVKFAKSEILRIEMGGGAAGEFQGRYKKAQGNLRSLETLMDWCKDKGLRLEREFVGYRILVQDPTHQPARKAVRRPNPIQ